VPTKQAETGGQEFHTRTLKVKNRFYILLHEKTRRILRRKSKIGMGAEKRAPAATEKEREQIGRDVKG